MDRPYTKRLGSLHSGGTIGLLAAAILCGLVLPTKAQKSAAGGGAFVGLPPPSKLIGPLRVLPDGKIAVIPEAARPPVRHSPAHALPLPRVRPPKSLVVRPAITVIRPTASPDVRSGDQATPSAHAAPAYAAVPSPRPTIVSQIHNAPGWQPSHTYHYATGPYTRVVNGPGWAPAKSGGRGFLHGIVSTLTNGPGRGEPNGLYHPGRTLDAYQLTSTGSCTSASSGGPIGTGAAIKDGTCTWKHLSRVDYISITGWAFDNKRWKSDTLYHYRDYVTAGSPLRAYALIDDSCTSMVAPSGRGGSFDGFGKKITASDGCHWDYLADIIYSSEKSYIPTQTHTSLRSGATLHMQANYEAQLWNDREYLAGQNGELAPIRTQDHMDNEREGAPPFIGSCPRTARCYHLIITTAAGESFRDSLTPADPLTGYDPSKGVAIRNNLPRRWPHEPAGIDVHDNFVDLIGLQIKSVHGAAVNGKSSFGNAMTIRDCILDGGSEERGTSHAAVTLDTSGVVANSLIISHGQIGIDFKYPGYALHNTIVNPDRVANSVGITTWHNWSFKGQTVSNTAIFGFAHAAASTAEDPSKGPSVTWRGVTWLGGHNVTDAPRDDTTTNTPGGRVYILPGTTYGASASAAFAAPGSDWRAKDDGPLAGTGSAFGMFGLYCRTGGSRPEPNCPGRVNYDFDTPDIVGTARPQAGHFDIGAWQSCPSPAPGHPVRCSSDRRTAPVVP